MDIVTFVWKKDFLAIEEERIVERLPALKSQRLIVLKSALIEMTVLEPGTICGGGLRKDLRLRRGAWIRCSVLKRGVRAGLCKSSS